MVILLKEKNFGPNVRYCVLGSSENGVALSRRRPPHLVSHYTSIASPPSSFSATSRSSISKISRHPRDFGFDPFKYMKRGSSALLLSLTYYHSARARRGAHPEGRVRARVSS